MTHLYTIGYSNQTLKRFIELCEQHCITAIADVRSTPSSRYTPQFNASALKRPLEAAGIAYVSLGKELGARPQNLSWYNADGQLNWDKFASSELFQSGLDRAMVGARKFKLALSCTEKDPLDCHRTILIAQQLHLRGSTIDHILSDGSIENHTDALLRLRSMHGLEQPTLIDSENDLTTQALKLQEHQIAYKLPQETT